MQQTSVKVSPPPHAPPVEPRTRLWSLDSAMCAREPHLRPNCRGHTSDSRPAICMAWLCSDMCFYALIFPPGKATCVSRMGSTFSSVSVGQLSVRRRGRLCEPGRVWAQAQVFSVLYLYALGRGGRQSA